MRFAILVKATEATEAGVLPGEETLREVVEYHEELQKAADRERERSLFHADLPVLHPPGGR